MESCVYAQVGVDTVPRKHFFRQLFISSGVWTMYFICGLSLGAPTVFVPQLRREIKDSAVLGDELASWLYSVFGLAAVPWVLILPIIIRYFGCRVTCIIMSIDILIYYIIFCTSNHPLQILIAEIVFGLAYAGVLIIGIYVISEYTLPKYRGIFLTIKSASLFWGIWCSNAIGTFLHWKYITAAGFVCCVYMFGSFFWIESPYWLAANGRIEDCKRSHRWIFSNNIESEKNLERLINSIDHSKKDKWSLRRFLSTVCCREFYKPVMLCFVLLVQYNLTGKFVCSIYSIDIIKRITKNESTAYTGMLILDGVTVCSTYFGCFISNLFKRRSMYLTTSTIGIIFLLIISVYLYLIKLGIIVENKYVSIILLMCFTLPITCGPMILNTTIAAEIVPLKYKEFAVLITTVIFYILVALTLKVAPFLFKTLGMHGTFLFFAISSGVCTFLLYLYLPETKNKTLKDIEELFKIKDIDNRINFKDEEGRTLSNSNM